MSPKDPLTDFAVWEGEQLGPDENRPPGFVGMLTPPKTHLHIAGAWGTSAAFPDQGDLVPGVYLKLVARARGPHPYHVITGIITADGALELASILVLAAARAVDDIEAEAT